MLRAFVSFAFTWKNWEQRRRKRKELLRVLRRFYFSLVTFRSLGGGKGKKGTAATQGEKKKLFESFLGVTAPGQRKYLSKFSSLSSSLSVSLLLLLQPLKTALGRLFHIAWLYYLFFALSSVRPSSRPSVRLCVCVSVCPSKNWAKTTKGPKAAGNH